MILPKLNQVYSGDFFYLTCITSSSKAVKWFFKDQEQPHQTNNTWRIAAARAEHSGNYHCVVNSVKSNNFEINVLGKCSTTSYIFSNLLEDAKKKVKKNKVGFFHCVGFIPRASLTLNTGQPVMRPGSSVTLHIENEDGLQGWMCWVYKGGRKNRIVLRLSNDTVRLPFSPGQVVKPENIFWCTDKEQLQRSNQIIIQTSGNIWQHENMFGFTSWIYQTDQSKANHMF